MIRSIFEKREKNKFHLKIETENNQHPEITSQNSRASHKTGLAINSLAEF